MYSHFQFWRNIPTYWLCSMSKYAKNTSSTWIVILKIVDAIPTHHMCVQITIYIYTNQIVFFDIICLYIRLWFRKIFLIYSYSLKLVYSKKTIHESPEKARDCPVVKIFIFNMKNICTYKICEQAALFSSICRLCVRDCRFYLFETPTQHAHAHMKFHN